MYWQGLCHGLAVRVKWGNTTKCLHSTFLQTVSAHLVERAGDDDSLSLTQTAVSIFMPISHLNKLRLKKLTVLSWPVWLRWLEHRSIAISLWVRFPVRAHAWVAGSIPGLDRSDSPSGCMQEATNWCFSLTSSFLSLPSYLSKSNEKTSSGED